MKYSFYDTAKYKCKLEREPGYRYKNCKAKDTASAHEFLKYELGLGDETDMVFLMLCLDIKGQIIGVHEVSRGQIGEALVNPAEVFKRAILNNATHIIIARNSPSGIAEPSTHDIKTAERLADGGELLGVKVIDFIIIGDDEWYSFKLEGLI